MPTILFTPIASEDLVEIWTYISLESNDETADRFLDRIRVKCEAIAATPLGFPERPELFDGVRFFPFKSYLIFYLALEEGIEVLRVLHSARDIDALFDDGEKSQLV